jgi:Flp pilus assembly protein TadB
MGRRGKGGGRPPIKGFRPGKEPAHLRRRQAKAQLGPDANWAQKRMVDAIGDQSPRDVEKMLNRWVRILLAVAIALVALGAFLYTVSLVAGIVVHVLAALALFAAFRMRRQREQFVRMAESLGGGRG